MTSVAACDMSFRAAHFRSPRATVELAAILDIPSLNGHQSHFSTSHSPTVCKQLLVERDHGKVSSNLCALREIYELSSCHSDS